VGAAGAARHKIRIPLRVRPGEPLNIRPEDVILQEGDIIYIAAREADVFYTGGLLPAGEYTLPRDTDLDVLEAIMRVGGALNSGGLSTINITGSLIIPGIGFPSPSLASVIRRTPDGGQVVIRHPRGPQQGAARPHRAAADPTPGHHHPAGASG
jgi:hypothetical protein